MNLSVVGSRSFASFEILPKRKAKSIIQDFMFFYKIEKYISGGAKGPDSWGEEIADNFKLSKIIYRPDWNKYGKSAGYKRNIDIINNADYVLIFWDGKSKGTMHDIKLARKNKKPYALYVWQKTDEWREIESTIN
jgi:hypothetical protein